MNSDHSVSKYIDDLKKGNQYASQKIWERFFGKLIRLADRRLKASPRKAMNEEDVVQVAFAEFFSQVQKGRFPNLNDRNDLWQILAMLVDRRAKDQMRRLSSQRMGGGKVRTESVFLANDHADGQFGIANVADVVPTPELAMEFTEQFRARLASLKDDEFRNIALLKMQGNTNREIADQLKIGLRTVERRLDNIRTLWSIKTDHEA